MKRRMDIDMNDLFRWFRSENKNSSPLETHRVSKHCSTLEILNNKLADTIEQMKKTNDLFESFYVRHDLVLNDELPNAMKITNYNLYVVMTVSKLNCSFNHDYFYELKTDDKILDRNSTFIEPSNILKMFQSIFSKIGYNTSANKYSKNFVFDINGSRHNIYFIPIFVVGMMHFCPSSFFFHEENYWTKIDFQTSLNVLNHAPNTNQVFKLLLKLVEALKINAFERHLTISLINCLIIKNSRDNKIWEARNLDKICLEAIDLLKSALEQKHLQHFMFPHYNILSSLNDVKQESLTKKLEWIIDGIRTNPTRIPKKLMPVDVATTFTYPPLKEMKYILKDVVKIDDTEKQFNATLVTKILELVRKDLSPLKVVRNIYHTGSYYENLRVGHATEFDFNIILFFPFQHKKISFEAPSCESESVYIKLKLTDSFENSYSKRPCDANYKHIFAKFFDRNRYFVQSKVNSWFQGVVDKLDFVKNRASLSETLEGVKNMTVSQHGPARTFKIETTKDETIDFDLVPVFEFPFKKFGLPRGAYKHSDIGLTSDDKDWCIVPKPYKGPSRKDKTLLWRQHMASAEKKLLEGRDSVKPIIKLIKLLRDAQKWDCIASYFIKQLAYKKIREKWSDSEYWKESNMPIAFMELLHLFQECLKSRHLESFFFPTYNVLGNIKPATLQNYHNKLTRVIEDLPNNTKACFGV